MKTFRSPFKSFVLNDLKGFFYACAYELESLVTKPLMHLA